MNKIFWWFMCMFWSPFELIYIICHPNKEISKIAKYLANKLNL